MNRFGCLMIFGGLALAGPAAAQVAGTYIGHSLDGEYVQFNVSPQNGSNDLWVHDATVYIQARCEKSHSTVSWGESYGVGATIVNGKANANTSFSPYFNIKFDLKFSADGQTATGSIASIIPALDLKHIPATRALFCVSARQRLQVTLLQGGATTIGNPSTRTPGSQAANSR
jgi:hypothetical protein